MSEQRDEMVTRQERREKRLDKKREKMPQHGRGMAHMYKQVVEKRARSSKNQDTSTKQ